MTTQLLYQTDSYLIEFTAEVVDRRARGVVLDRMAFFPGAGGQPPDAGTLVSAAGRATVTGFELEDHEFVVLVDGILPEVGDEVCGLVDWERRYSLMRTHTSLHLLAGVVGRDYGGVILSRSMDPLRGRVDFELEAVPDELPRQVEAALQREIAANRQVTVSFLTPEEFLARPDLIRTKTNQVPRDLDRIRVVEIDGLDRQADGGTHVASTSEVRALRITAHQSRGRGKRRLRIALDAVPLPAARHEHPAWP